MLKKVVRALLVKARANTLRSQHSTSEMQAQSLAEELRVEKARVEEAESSLAALRRSEEEWRVSFLQSSEFKTAVEESAYSFFRTGFNKCEEQFKEAGLLPEDREGFPDFDRVIKSLPKEDEEMGERALRIRKT